MIRYLVKVINTALPSNKSFPEGTQSVYYYGVDQFCIGAEGECPKRYGMEQEIDTYLVREYGYKSEATAKRSWIFTHRNDEKLYTNHWKSYVCIVPVEC